MLKTDYPSFYYLLYLLFMLSICILQTQSPLKHLPDFITGHSDFFSGMEEKCSYSAAPGKRWLLPPCPKVRSQLWLLNLLVYVGVSPVQSKEAAQTGWRGLVCPGHVSMASSISSGSNSGSPKTIGDLFCLRRYCSKTSKSRNGMFMETLKTSTENWCHLIWLLLFQQASQRTHAH